MTRFLIDDKLWITSNDKQLNRYKSRFLLWFLKCKKGVRSTARLLKWGVLHPPNPLSWSDPPQRAGSQKSAASPNSKCAASFAAFERGQDVIEPHPNFERVERAKQKKTSEPQNCQTWAKRNRASTIFG